jgi:hypothetical protein
VGDGGQGVVVGRLDGHPDPGQGGLHLVRAVPVPGAEQGGPVRGGVVQRLPEPRPLPIRVRRQRLPPGPVESDPAGGRPGDAREGGELDLGHPGEPGRVQRGGQLGPRPERDLGVEGGVPEHVGGERAGPVGLLELLVQGQPEGPGSHVLEPVPGRHVPGVEDLAGQHGVHDPAGGEPEPGQERQVEPQVVPDHPGGGQSLEHRGEGGGRDGEQVDQEGAGGGGQLEQPGPVAGVVEPGRLGVEADRAAGRGHRGGHGYEVG